MAAVVYQIFELLLWVAPNMTQSHDAFRNLYGSLQFMKFIEVLNLANNNIKDLSTVLQQLSIFRSLRQLGEIVESPWTPLAYQAIWNLAWTDLSGNPVAEETAYRMHVIDKLPQVSRSRWGLGTVDTPMRSRRCKCWTVQRSRAQSARKQGPGKSGIKCLRLDLDLA